jgi:hypothetical protein
MRNFVLFIAIIFSANISFGQFIEHGDRFVEFIVPQINSVKKKNAVDEYMRKVEGVKMSRMDLNTGRYYAILDIKAVHLDQAWFIDRFAEKGMKIFCFYSGIYGKDAFQDITRMNCQEIPEDMKIVNKGK